MQTNQVLDLPTHVKANFCQFLMKYMLLLIVIQLSMLEVYFQIYLKHLTVWHEGLIYKIKSIGISGPLLKLIESFLSNRYQRVLLNGQSSTWFVIIAGVLQGSILGPLFFLIYINDLSKNLSSIKNFLLMIHPFSLLFMMLPYPQSS